MILKHYKILGYLLLAISILFVLGCEVNTEPKYTGNGMAEVTYLNQLNGVDTRIFIIEENGDSRYHIGYVLGQKMREAIPNITRKILMYLEVMTLYHMAVDVDVFELNERAHYFENTLKDEALFPGDDPNNPQDGYLAEIRGFADGVDGITDGGTIGYIHILKTALFMDIFQVNACTGVATDQTPDGHPIVARNIDWITGGILQDVTCLYVWVESDESGTVHNVHCNLGFAAVLSTACGMNQFGLTADILENIMDYEPGIFNYQGSTSIYYGVREALSTMRNANATVDNILTYFDAPGYAEGNAFIFNHGTNCIFTDSINDAFVGVEFGPTPYISIRAPGDAYSFPDWMFLTNHCVALEDEMGINNDDDYYNSVARFARTRQLVENQLGNTIAWQDIMGIITDTNPNQWSNMQTYIENNLPNYEAATTPDDRAYPIYLPVRRDYRIDDRGTTILTSIMTTEFDAVEMMDKAVFRYFMATNENPPDVLTDANFVEFILQDWEQYKLAGGM